MLANNRGSQPPLATAAREICHLRNEMNDLFDAAPPTQWPIPLARPPPPARA